MSGATIAADETLQLRLKAMHLPSFLEHYLGLAERAAAEGWSHVRYLTELVTLEAHDRADRRMTRLLRDAKLPREKTPATLDLNRFAAPLRGQIRQLLRGEFLAGATNVCLIGHTHIAMFAVLRADETQAEIYQFRDGTTLDLLQARYIVNPGSVGQPRDRDPRAAYAILDTERGTITAHRVEYDVSTTQRQMALANLPDVLIARLAHGM